MAKFTFKELVNDGDVITAKMTEAGILDADVGKPVKLASTDTYSLCTDGDQIDGFIKSIEPYTADGKVVASIQIGGRKRVELEGAVALGSLVEAGTVAAAGTAEANGLPMVSIHTPDITTTTTLRDTTFSKNWRTISGTALDNDTTTIIEKL